MSNHESNDVVTQRSLHWSFWLIAILSLVWNGMGCINYLMQTNPEMLAKMPETHRPLIENRPAWATAGFAFAVFGGVLGSVLLLMKKSLATILFAISFIGVIVAMIHGFGMLDQISVSMGELFLMFIAPLVVAAFLLWYAKYAQGRGWIR